MNNSSVGKTLVLFVTVVLAVTLLSILSVRMWGGKTETAAAPIELTIAPEMTVMAFGQVNGLANPVLKEIFSLTQKSELQKPLADFGSEGQVRALVVKKMALAAEHASKPWRKIAIKFPAWFLFLAAVFVLFRQTKMTSGRRMILLATSVTIFGVVLGSDPSPMGTVKDAIHLLATTGAIFPPRLIALAVFLLIVFLANKFICGWGCQAGTLQDIIFRLNRNSSHRGVVARQVKLPFGVTNTIRILFLILFTVAALAWGTDLISPVDPFKIYKPMHLGVVGALAVGALFAASLFVYRPWCHLFCPFGLVGWLVEKVSLARVQVDYGSCIACEKCVQSCPSTAMETILKQEKTVADCFACYNCREACPTGAVRFGRGKRQPVPTGHFDRPVSGGE